MANWSGAGSGALSGAALGTQIAPGWGTVIGGAAGGLKGLFSKKKKKSSAPTWTPQPYSGYRPPRIDYTGNPESSSWLSGNFPESMKSLVQGTSGKEMNTLRPVSSLYTGMVANRAQGNDIGYDPSWLNSSQALIRSELGKSEEDILRDAKGAQSASGLSGNLRAYEALAGRVKRNTQRELQDATSKLNIADMERKALEKYGYTGMLGNLNQSNFNQENAAAEFDRAVWEAEQLNNAKAAGINMDAYQTDNIFDENESEGQMGFGTDILQNLGGSGFLNNLGPSAQSLLNGNQTGKGIAGYSNFDPNMPTSGGGYRQVNPRKTSLVR